MDDNNYYLLKADGPGSAFILALAHRDSHATKGAEHALLNALILRSQVNEEFTEATCRVGKFQLHLDTNYHEETLREAAVSLEKPIEGKRARLLKRKRTMNGANYWRINAKEIWRLARIAHERDKKLIADHRAETANYFDSDEGFGDEITTDAMPMHQAVVHMTPVSTGAPNANGVDDVSTVSLTRERNFGKPGLETANA